MLEMRADLIERQEAAKEAVLKINFIFEKNKVLASQPNGVYGDYAIMHIIEDNRVDEATDMLQYVTNWFDHVHPTDRDPRGEVDFLAIRLIMALYEERCYSKLSDSLKADIKRFFLQKDFQSKHASENHSHMFRASRLLAAQFYKGEYFENYGKTAEELMEIDTQWLNDFLNFRAGYGWAEFDSCGYMNEEFIILDTVYNYTEDPELKLKVRMTMDTLLLDMMGDSLDALYGGAHGRIYEGQVIHRAGGMISRYSYYFGGKYYSKGVNCGVMSCYSKYQPSDILYKLAEGRKYPYENRERSHIHCDSIWYKEIPWDYLNRMKNYSISKYTYVSEDYLLGGVTKQDNHPPFSKDKYPHPQQEEWELTLPGDNSHKIFSHHCMPQDYYHINNRWTGDWGCCCGSFYSNKNTAVSMYNIGKDKDPLVNAYCPLNIFSQKIFDGKYLFLEYNKLYISLYFDNGFRVCEDKDDKFFEKELLSEGHQNAVVLRVEYKDGFESLEAFGESIKAKPVVFDREKRTVTFDGIELRVDGSKENGKENLLHYGKTFDNPFVQSEWGSGVIEIKFENETVIYDFNNNKIINK